MGFPLPEIERQYAGQCQNSLSWPKRYPIQLVSCLSEAREVGEVINRYSVVTADFQSMGLCWPH